MNKKILNKIFIYFSLCFVSFVSLFPSLWILLTSLKSEKEIHSSNIHLIPQNPNFENYLNVFKELPDLITYIKNSTIITGIVVISTLIIASFAGYAFARMKFKCSSVLLGSILFVITIPAVVFLIPIYTMEANLGILNTYIGLIIPYIASSLPFAIFIMRGTYRGISNSIEEAAIIDGCSSFQLFYKIMVPLGIQGIITVAVLTFLSIWGEFILAFSLVEESRMRTLPVGIVLLKGEGGSWSYGLLSAAVIISIIPSVILFLILQRYFVRGIMQGAIKG